MKEDYESRGLCAYCSKRNSKYCEECQDASCFSVAAPPVRQNLQAKIKDHKSIDYSVGGIECLDVIKAKLTPDQYRGFLLGNIIKYACRANNKGSFSRDMEKVRFYAAAIFDTLPIGEERK